MASWLLAACTASASPEPAAAGPSSGGVAPVKCVVADFSALVGKPKDVLAATTFPQGLAVRVIAPNQPVTMDYSESRVNLLTDAKGVIREITCG
jgi:hypothetical protein